MISSRRRTNAPPLGRVPLLLVLAVLAGLMSMHGPTALPVTGHAASSGGHSEQHGAGARPAPAPEIMAADLLCHHHSSGGHADHTVSDCAAAGTATAYLPPAPARFFHTAVSRTAKALRLTSAERAPPDLAQLQLLRI